VTDNKGATGTVTHDVTVTAPPANQPPVAAFTSSAVNLAASFDGSTSSDPDGTVAGYAWTFGDGSTGTGATASHTYAAAGTYTVTLTVTDNVGATNATSKSVTVAAPPANTIAQDAFERATTNGWGSADVGGPWTLAGGSTSFLTGGGFGQQVAGAGQTKTATLGGVSSTNADLQTTISIDKAATGGGAYVSAIGRAVGSAGYEARVLIKSTGVVQLQLLQGATTLQALNLPGITYAAGDQLRVRVQVFGTSPTTIRAKVWPVGQTEPAAWQLSATDATAALQVAGSVGLRTYISASATVVPVTARFDDFIVSPAQ
jgi:PKD repeat protein